MPEQLYHDAPEWLTKSYLENVLRKYKNDHNLKIIRLKIKPATAKGENYASVMTRVLATISYEKDNEICEHDESLIVKSTYEGDPFLCSIMNEYKCFQTEMEMYEVVSPRLTALLREAGDGDQDKLFAESIHVDHLHSAIIFEDLSVSDFVLADRLAGMDMTHAKLALKKLAKMHAAAAVLNQRSGGMLEHFNRGIQTRHANGITQYFLNMIDDCVGFVRECKELGEYYAKKLLDLKLNLREYALRVHDPCEYYFNTLNHGDYWINNIMVRYGLDGVKNTKSLQDLLLVDLQFCNWASPAVDLHYFFNTSLEWDLRQHQQDELVQYYHTHLSNTLRALKYTKKIPTLHDLWVQLEAGRFYAVTSSVIVQPVMINDDTNDADFNALLLNDERAKRFRKSLYANPVVQKYLKALLPVFDRHGLLDVKQ